LSGWNPNFAILGALLAGACAGQGLESASATLNPAGGVSYEASFAFPLTPWDGPAVTGAPYSAEETSHELIRLENGSRGEQTELLRKVYRDSAGRTRIERRLQMGPRVANAPLVAEIADPVAGYHYVLDLEKKVAHRYAPPKPGAETPGARRVATAILPANNAPAGEKLGARVVDGMTLEGLRYRVGSSITEVWTSPDLKVAVVSKVTDAEGGERTVQLTKLSRSEPDAGLFAVPDSFKIEDETAEFHIDFTIEK
jgi:hypothetical protein